MLFLCPSLHSPLYPAQKPIRSVSGQSVQKKSCGCFILFLFLYLPTSRYDDLQEGGVVHNPPHAMAADATGFSLDHQQITSQDLQTLGEEQLLNDKVINVFISLLKKRVAAHDASIFIASTHLCTKIMQRDGARQASENWFSKQLLLLPYKWIFIPVHHADSSHWSLLLVTNIREWLLQHTEEVAAEKAVPHFAHRKRSVAPLIVALDSMDISCDHLIPSLTMFLVYRWFKELRDVGAVVSPHTNEEDLAGKLLRNVPFVSADLPQQENSHDCGVYVVCFGCCFGAFSVRLCV